MPEPSPVAVALHGGGAGGWQWAIWRRVFAAADRTLHAPDLQPSPAGLAATTLDDYRGQVRAALAGLPAPVLVGASLGGWLALAESAPARALVLLNPVPPAPYAARLPARRFADGIVPWGRGASLAGTRRALPDADPAAALLAFRSWRDDGAAAVAAAWAGQPLPAPRCPVLLVASDGDDDIPAGVTEALAEAWAAPCWRVPGSHAGPLLGRQAAGLAARVLDWLAQALR